MPTWVELSCGECGESKMRCQVLLYDRSWGGTAAKLKLTCARCGSVTRIAPQPELVLLPGRAEEGEKDAGGLCPMDWPRDQNGALL